MPRKALSLMYSLYLGISQSQNTTIRLGKSGTGARVYGFFFPPPPPPSLLPPLFHTSHIASQVLCFATLLYREAWQQDENTEEISSE